MATERIENPADPRIRPYQSLKARTERGEPILIADGRRVLVNLLDAGAPIRSVLVEEHVLEETEALLAGRPGIPLFVASAELLKGIVGYNYHRGVMAALDHPGLSGITGLGPRVVVMAGLDKGENVGAILRNCAAFGVDSVILGPGCATPFQRNAIRASRGQVFRMKVHQSDDLADTIERLQDRGYRVYATNQTRDSVAYDELDPGDAWALILGNEGHGVDPAIQRLTDRAVTIPMAASADSLNVAAASAVILARWYKKPGRPADPPPNGPAPV